MTWLGPARHPANIQPGLGVACRVKPVPGACQELVSDEMGAPLTRMIPGDAAQEAASPQEKYWMPNLYCALKTATYSWMLGSAVITTVLPDNGPPAHCQPRKVNMIDRSALYDWPNPCGTSSVCLLPIGQNALMAWKYRPPSTMNQGPSREQNTRVKVVGTCA